MHMFGTRLNDFSVCGKPSGKCLRFWFRLRHTVILISKVRTSASKKINLMALIRILMTSTTMLERMKERCYGFRQTVLDLVIIEPGNTMFIESFGSLQKSMVIFVTKETSRTKSPPSDTWEGRRETASSFLHS